MALMSLRSRSHVKASIVLKRADHLHRLDYIFKIIAILYYLFIELRITHFINNVYDQINNV